MATVRKQAPRTPLEPVEYSHVMIDLETRGVRPGCAILSIGAVFFNPTLGRFDLGPEFYQVVNHQSCVAAGLHEDPGTMAFWNRQSEDARRVIYDSEDETVSQSLSDSLVRFNAYLKMGKSVKVWGNGADFDNPILASAYHAVDFKQGWAPYNGRCYRTVKNLDKSLLLERQGTHHNALDDAKSQAVHLMQLVAKHKLVLS